MHVEKQCIMHLHIAAQFETGTMPDTEKGGLITVAAPALYNVREGVHHYCPHIHHATGIVCNNSSELLGPILVHDLDDNLCKHGLRHFSQALHFQHANTFAKHLQCFLQSVSRMTGPVHLVGLHVCLGT